MNRGALKIIGFCLAALVLAGVVQFARMRSENQRIAREFLDSIAHMRQTQTAQNAALQVRFDQLDLDHALVAPELATTDGVRRGRAVLARFRALLSEREQLATDQAATGHRLIMQLPAGVMRDNALRGEAQTTGRTRQLQDEMTRAEAANANAIEAILDWADRYHPLLKARGDELMVNGQQPLDEFKRLETTLHETGQAVQTALDQGKAREAESGRTLTKLQQEVRE